ncbi:MAG: hypothetical protein JWQ03_1202, partial [Variovorax sp.]|nr:hypothetical protein [Variovorax sp.]
MPSSKKPVLPAAQAAALSGTENPLKAASASAAATPSASVARVRVRVPAAKKATPVTLSSSPATDLGKDADTAVASQSTTLSATDKPAAKKPGRPAKVAAAGAAPAKGAKRGPKPKGGAA